MGQDELCKVISPKVSESPKQDSENCKIGDFQEPDYIDADIFTPIVKTGFRKFRKAKSLNQIIWVKQIVNLMTIAIRGYFALLEMIQS